MRRPIFGFLVSFLALPGCSGGSSHDGGPDGFDADGDGDGDAEGARDGDTDEGAGPCTEFGAGVVTGTIESAALVELSGLAASRTHDEALYGHNDSGDTARFFAMGTDGRLVAEVSLVGTAAVDWEDMALGPGPSGDGDWLYFGDIGDNTSRRAGVLVFAVAEPAALVGGEVSGVQRLPFEYPDGAHNAETLMVDPRNGDIYILTKADDGTSGLYLSPAPQEADIVRTLELVGTVVFGAGSLPGSPLATAGDISPRGDAILVRTYDHVFLWTRGADQTVADAMGGTPIELPSVTEDQGEAIAFAPDGLGYYTSSEGTGQPITFFPAACAP